MEVSHPTLEVCHPLSTPMVQGTVATSDNAGKTPGSFEMPLTTTSMKCGTKDAKLLSVGNEHSWFTVTLTCTKDGRKLPPFVMLKRKTMPKVVFPPDVIHVNEKGYTDEAMMFEWLA